jgi:hypothetical protein
MELELVKVKLIKVQKILVIKYNIRNKFKDIKDRNKIKMQMLIKNKRMISKWKEILKEISTPKRRREMKMIQSKVKKNKQIKKWEMLIMNNDNKISKMIREKLKVNNKLMCKLMDNNKDNLS